MESKISTLQQVFEVLANQSSEKGVPVGLKRNGVNLVYEVASESFNITDLIKEPYKHYKFSEIFKSMQLDLKAVFDDLRPKLVENVGNAGKLRLESDADDFYWLDDNGEKLALSELLSSVRFYADPRLYKILEIVEREYPQLAKEITYYTERESHYRIIQIGGEFFLHSPSDASDPGVSLTQMLFSEQFNTLFKPHDKPYKYGPLNKEQPTYTLEEICIELIKKDKNSIYPKISIVNNELMYQTSASVEAINLGEILKNANLTQLELQEDTFSFYQEDEAFMKPTINDSPLLGDSTTYDLSEAFFTKNIQAVGQKPEEFGELHLVEKAAIFHYTTEEAYDMNKLLRGKYNELDRVNRTSEKLRYLLINTILAASGLNKLRAVTVDLVVRSIADISIVNTDGNSCSLIEQMKLNVDQQVVSTEKAFMSGAFAFSTDSAADMMINIKDAPALIIRNVKGKRIHGLSSKPQECEFLIPPSTQLRWVSYQKKEDDTFIFAVEGANVVDNAEKPHETTINSDVTADSLPVEVVGNPEILNPAVDTPVENPSAEISQELMYQKIKSFCEQQSLLLLKEKKFLLNETERQTFLENLPRLEAISDIEQLKAFYNRALELENKSYASKDFLDQLCEFFEDLVDFFVHGYDYVSHKQQARNARDSEQAKTNQAISSLLCDTRQAILPKNSLSS